MLVSGDHRMHKDLHLLPVVSQVADLELDHRGRVDRFAICYTRERSVPAPLIATVAERV